MRDILLIESGFEPPNERRSVRSFSGLFTVQSSTRVGCPASCGPSEEMEKFGPEAPSEIVVGPGYMPLSSRAPCAPGVQTLPDA
jgi:hypothetical protein